MSFDLESILVKSLLSAKAQEQFAQGDISKDELFPYIQSLLELSASYVSGRANKINSILTAKAYALYYLPINFAKFSAMFSMLPSYFFNNQLTALDFGCGPGTASLALCAAGFKGKINAVDSSSYMLDTAREITGNTEFNHQISFSTNYQGSYDLIILGNVLNELNIESSKTLVAELLKVLKTRGVLIILEPALKHESVSAMQLRDYIFEQNFNILPIFPCTHTSHCPMLKLDKDNWCHGTLSWDEPRLVRLIDKYTGFNKHRLKYTSFILQKCESKPQPNAALRILDTPTKSKRGIECLLCGAEYYGKKLLDKSKYKKVKQFDLVEI